MAGLPLQCRNSNYDRKKEVITLMDYLCLIQQCRDEGRNNACSAKQLMRTCDGRITGTQNKGMSLLVSHKKIAKVKDIELNIIPETR